MKEIRVPMFVEILKDRFVPIDALIKDTEKASGWRKEALAKMIANLDQWQSLSEPVLEYLGMHELDPVFRAIKRVRKQLGDAWPLHELPDLEDEK